MMSPKVKGSLCGVLAAVFYGTNPLGTLPLYAQGISSQSVLFYRYFIGVVLLAAIMGVRRMSFAVNRKQLVWLMVLGVLFAISSLTLYLSFLYLDAGVASTMLFVYPVMVAVIMTLFFHERLKASTVISIALALSGIALLSHGEGGKTLSLVGIGLVMASSLSYAIYIVAVNRLPLEHVSSFTITFWVLVSGTATIVVYSWIAGSGIQWLHGLNQWAPVAMLGLLPTVLSLVLMAIAVKDVGATPTAIMGALEPLTAVAIGIGIFGEAFTARLAVGIVMVLVAVILIVTGGLPGKRQVKKVAHMVGHAAHVITHHHWRWK